MVSGLLIGIIVLLIVGIVTGRWIGVLPIISFLGMILIFTLGARVVMYIISNPYLLGAIIVLFLISWIRKKKNPKRYEERRSRFYYYNSTNGDSPDFEEFFRRAEGFQYENPNQNYMSSRATDYENLGLSEGATKEEIKKAYRDKAKLYHPDKYNNAPENERLIAEQKFKEINQSYNNLMKDFE